MIYKRYIHIAYNYSITCMTNEDDGYLKSFIGKLPINLNILIEDSHSIYFEFYVEVAS